MLPADHPFMKTRLGVLPAATLPYRAKVWESVRRVTDLERQLPPRAYAATVAAMQRSAAP